VGCGWSICLIGCDPVVVLLSERLLACVVCQCRAEKAGGNFRYLFNVGKWHSIYVAYMYEKVRIFKCNKKNCVQCVNETIVITTKTYFVNVNGTAAHMRTH
jgi:hypothetical protein